MGRLIYNMLLSLDGYIEDASGRFDWAAPDEEVHTFVNDLARSAGTHLYGRRMYEVMQAWEGIGGEPDQPPYMVDFANIWRAADKIVYSTSLEHVSTERTRLERRFDPEAVRALKARDGRDVLIGGPGLASRAIRAGLVDVFQFFLAPIAVGGGKRALPDDVRVDLRLVESRRFGNGMVYVQYDARPDAETVGTLREPTPNARP